MADKPNNKRSRSANWSPSEKALLTQLIKEKNHLIENKDVSKNNNLLKKNAWQDILQSFNELSQTTRDLPQLLNQWRNTKINIKKREYQYRRDRLATGGGPPPPSPPPEDVEIMELLPHEFEVDENLFDSDSLNVKKDNDVKKKNIVDSLAADVDLTNPPGCSSAQPTLMMQIPATEMQIPLTEIKTNEIEETRVTKRPKNTKKKVTNTAESHELFLLAKRGREKQIKNQEEEHKKRFEIMQREHEMRMVIMEKELQYWKKNMKTFKEYKILSSFIGF